MKLTQADIVTLPTSLRQYLKTAGVIGQPMISTLSLAQRGQFTRDGKRITRLTARQQVDVAHSGFVWQGKAGLLRVTDQFVGREGSLRITLMGSFTLNSLSGPEVDQAEAQRYLAEMVWYPTAFVYPQFDYQQVDAKTVEVSWEYRVDNTAVITLHFDDESMIHKITARRFREVKGQFELSDWEILLNDYRPYHGILVPTKAEVNWRFPEGELCYYDFELTDLQFGFRQSQAVEVERLLHTTY